MSIPPPRTDKTTIALVGGGLFLLGICCCSCSSSFLSLIPKGSDTGTSPTDPDETDDVAPPPIKVSAGTSVQCVANELRGKEGSIYRSMEDGTLAYYPNPEIASSWNPNWSKGIIELDCAGFTKGEDLNKNTDPDSADGIFHGATSSPTVHSCTETCQITTTSENGKYLLVMQDDGNLVIYEGTVAKWSSGTHGKGTKPYKLVMQGDGNLVIYDNSNDAIWASNTAGKGTGPYRLVMQDDRNLVIYDKNDTSLWASNTPV